jgi:site-specific recombinase XerD
MVKKGNTREILRKEEINKLMLAPDNDRDKILLRVLYETGCSVSEAAEINVVDCKTEYIQIKGKKARKLSLSSELRELIAHFNRGRGLQDKLFAGTHGTITTKRLRQLVQQYTEHVLGKKLNPTVLRYTRFAHSVNEGGDLGMIQDNLGLATQRTGQLYSMFAVAAPSVEYQDFLNRA